MSGMQTMWAFIGNPYYDCPDDDCWRRKDGDTVIGCERSDWRARPVQDCYQQLREDWAEDKAEQDAYFARQDELTEEYHACDLWDATVGVFFDIQDRLDGIRLRLADNTEVGYGGYGMHGGLLARGLG